MVAGLKLMASKVFGTYRPEPAVDKLRNRGSLIGSCLIPLVLLENTIFIIAWEQSKPRTRKSSLLRTHSD